MPSEAEAREDPFADDTLVMREDVRREDIDEEGNVLHRADYNQNKQPVTRRSYESGLEVPIYSRCYTCQRCANWWREKTSQRLARIASEGDAALALAHGVRCVGPLSCSIPGSLVDPPSSCRGSVDPTVETKSRINHSTSVGLE